MTLSEEDFQFVRRVVHEEAGLCLDADKDYLVKCRLRPMATNQAGGNIGNLLQQVRSSPDPQLRRAIAEAMTIQETYFFRDPWFFDSLRQEVLPALIRARFRERTLRIWCAACATGQEVYSLSLVLEEHFPEIADWTVEILATDLSRSALVQASSGNYTQMEVNRGLPAQLLLKHFTRQGLRWQVRPAIRQRIRFQQLNLVGAWPPLPPFDLVLLRNVLIYFDTPARCNVLNRVRQQMRDDGYLFMGGTESPLGLVSGFQAGADGRACHYQLQQPGGGR